MSELVTTIRDAFNSLRGKIDELAQGKISVSLRLTTTQKIVISIFLALLFGIVLALIYSRAGAPNPLWIFILMIAAAILVYFLL